MAQGLFNEDLPQRLQQVISDCLEKDPDMRYQNAASLRADLKRVKRDLESGKTYCHRTLVANWFKRELGYDVEER